MMAPLDFPHRGPAELAPGSLHGLGLFAELDQGEMDAFTRRFRPGARIFAAGASAASVAVIVSGVVRTGRARLAAGQCVGAAEALARRMHARDAIAESSTVVLEVPVYRLRAWLATQSWEDTRVGRLAQIQRLPDQRLLTVFDTDRGTVTICGDPARDGVLTAEDGGHLVFARCRTNGHALEHTLRFEDRTVGLVDVGRRDDGTIATATIARITTTRGTGSARLYRRILERPQIDAAAVARFERSGELDPPASCALLCPCTGVSAEHVLDAETAGEVQRETAAGKICGGCRPRIDMLVDLRALARRRA